MTLGKRIRLERERRGWSQETFGRMVGRTKPAVSCWESDTYKPSIEDRVIISRILSIPFNELLPEADLADGSIVSVIADPILQQVMRLWPHIDAPLRQAVLLLCAELRHASTDKLSDALTERAV